MAGDAFDTITRFWQVQDAGDYEATVALFADDAVLDDPLYGAFEGRDAIAGFMAKMNEAVAKTNGSFRALEIAGGDDAGWARWEWNSDRGVRTGVGIYRVRDGQLTYYRDYLDEAPK